MTRKTGGSYSVNHSSTSRAVTNIAPVSPASFVTASSAVGSAQQSSLIITAPASIVSGNLLIAFLLIHHTNGSATSPDWTSTGWTEQSKSPTGGVGYICFMTKTATGAEPGSYTFTTTDFDYMAGGILQYSGANTSVAPSSSYVTTSSSQSVNAPSVTPGHGGMLLVCAFNNAQIAVFSSGPAGMTQRIQQRAAGGTGEITVYENTTTSGTPTGVQTATYGAPAGANQGASVLIDHK